MIDKSELSFRRVLAEKSLRELSEPQIHADLRKLTQMNANNFPHLRKSVQICENQRFRQIKVPNIFIC
jgi:hypothetical protein